jgi:hypothetical protein
LPRKRRSPDTLTRAYKCDLRSANPGKLAQLAQAQQRLVPEAQRISYYVERRVMTTGQLPALAGDLKFRNIPATGWAQPLYSHIVGQWAGWLANRQCEFARLVFQFVADKRLDEALRHELLLTSKCKLWHVPVQRGPAAAGGVTFTQAGRDAARMLFRIVCRAHAKPSFNNVPVHLDGRMAQLELADSSKFTHTTHWLRVNVPQSVEWPATPAPRIDDALVAERIGYRKKKEAGEAEDVNALAAVPRSQTPEPILAESAEVVEAAAEAAVKKRKSPAKLTNILLPLKLHRFVAEAVGTLNQSVALLPPREDKGRAHWELVLSRDSLQEDWPRPTAQLRLGCLAIDLGLATFIATNQGDLVEQGWMLRIEALDRDITALARGRAQRGLPVRCARYDEMVLRLRNWLKSRVGDALASLIRKWGPRTVVIESLDFRAPGLSRRLNRLLSNFGKALFLKWLTEHQRIHDFALEDVNAAFSSQQCPECGYVDPRNRVAQAQFVCLGCGHAAHADVNAAQNLAGRSRQGRSLGEEDLPVWAKPRQVFAWCWRAFLARQQDLAQSGRIWAADAGAATERLRNLLAGNRSFQRYGDPEWLTSSMTSYWGKPG